MLQLCLSGLEVTLRLPGGRRGGFGHEDVNDLWSHLLRKVFPVDFTSRVRQRRKEPPWKNSLSIITAFSSKRKWHRLSGQKETEVRAGRIYDSLLFWTGLGWERGGKKAPLCITVCLKKGKCRRVMNPQWNHFCCSSWGHGASRLAEDFYSPSLKGNRRAHVGFSPVCKAVLWYGTQN